ncbi:Glycosyl hydrolases family 43 [Arachidicoccus rhizosphaerae]|uniref:Glycosyl hydrolases family 43 n=2 Tax=Arachidicoccus rhizosphaerae TaxID=551991 RepID=A0A1H3Y662_9BACT|nr:Glycosyl hydrolases family 43 [Arachidicoccus rhizosphaerae]
MRLFKKLAFGLITCIPLMAWPGNSHAQNEPARENKPDAGYLFAYFEGKGTNQEALRFAVSQDAVHWKALNNNNPVIGSDSISATGGIRDPHILRGEKADGYFLVATDMNTRKNGWDYNPGIVMLHSKDLLNWSHSKIELSKQYPKKFANIKWVWAPQTIFDPKVNKYLVYFTVRFKDNEKLDFYAAYANKDFSGFEGTPKLLFSPEFGGIDADIIYKNGLYHFFFKGNTKNAAGKEIKNGIKQATSQKLWGPWKELPGYIDAFADKDTSVEGSSVFKLNDKDSYVLMYDLYGVGKYAYQTSADLNNFSKEPAYFTKDFNPRHGSVISISKAEARLLQSKWKGVPADLLRPNETGDLYHFTSNGNPIVTHEFTADPAALVTGDTMWLFTGRDANGGQTGYHMREWLAFSSTDMHHWTEYPTPMKSADFDWAKSKAAWAGQVIPRNGKYYWYFCTNWSGIGVAVADRPEGPYKDAIGKPLLTNKDCFASSHGWACLDPSVFIDDDGQAWLFWGNRECYYAKLKKNMTEIDGPVKQMMFPGFEFTEAVWMHKYKGKYYLSYSTGFPEKTAYAMADNIEGPYVYKGIINELAGNCNTNHHAILEFKGQWYFIYHNGGVEPDGGSFSRSVCSEFLNYNPDGTIQKIQMTTAGTDPGFVPFDNKNNPVLKGFYADPDIIYSYKDKKYYLYPTSDGFTGWSGTYFKAFSSDNLKEWKDEGVILNLKKDVSWSHTNAWAPTMIEKKTAKGYQYFYYFVAGQQIGVASSDSPTGPFKDSGKPLIPKETKGGQAIDPAVFHDPVSGKDYLYWGNGYLKVAELSEDMETLKEGSLKVITPDHTFREGAYVFYRNKRYYFMWSENDTRSPDYRVRYGYSDSPDGPITIPKNNLILQKSPENGIYGTGHNSVIQVPGKDQWYIVYHRFHRPTGIHMGDAAGYNREVCIDALEFNPDGSIKPVIPTL